MSLRWTRARSRPVAKFGDNGGRAETQSQAGQKISSKKSCQAERSKITVQKIMILATNHLVLTIKILHQYTTYRGVGLVRTMEIVKKSYELARTCKSKFLMKKIVFSFRILDYF